MKIHRNFNLHGAAGLYTTDALITDNTCTEDKIGHMRLSDRTRQKYHTSYFWIIKIKTPRFTVFFCDVTLLCLQRNWNHISLLYFKEATQLIGNNSIVNKYPHYTTYHASSCTEQFISNSGMYKRCHTRFTQTNNCSHSALHFLQGITEVQESGIGLSFLVISKNHGGVILHALANEAV